MVQWICLRVCSYPHRPNRAEILSHRCYLRCCRKQVPWTLGAIVRAVGFWMVLCADCAVTILSLVDMTVEGQEAVSDKLASWVVAAVQARVLCLWQASLALHRMVVV